MSNKFYELFGRKRLFQSLASVCEACTMVGLTEKMLTDYEDKIDKETKEKVCNALKDLKDTLKEKDVVEIENKVDALQETIQEISLKLYPEGKRMRKPLKPEENPSKVFKDLVKKVISLQESGKQKDLEEIWNKYLEGKEYTIGGCKIKFRRLKTKKGECIK